MEIKKKSTNKKIIVAVVILALVACGVTAGIIIYNNQNNQEQTKEESKPNSDKKEPEQNKDNDNDSDKDDDKDNSNQQTGENPADKTPPRYEGDSVQDKPELTGVINSAWVDNERNTVSTRVLIHQLVGDPNGECTLTMTNQNGQSYSFKAPLIDEPQTSTCYGWDIPLTSIGNNISGTWKFTVVATGNGRTGTFSKEFTF